MVISRDRVKTWISVLVGLLLAGLFAYTVYFFFFQAKIEIAEQLSSDVHTLKNILQKIDAQCEIMSFDQEKSYINFLNVGCFEGSEVGPMNLAYPKKWQGPYLKDNPTMQGFYYYVLKTPRGYYIVPGDGVKLRDGKILGKDIVITANSDIDELLKREPGLWFGDSPLITGLVLIRESKQKSLNHFIV